MDNDTLKSVEEIDLMSKLLLIILIFLTSCGYFEHHESKDTTSPMERVQNKRDYYVSLISDPASLVDRCDGLTFLGLYDAYGQRLDNLYRFEYSYSDPSDKLYATGQWNRDVELCYELDLNNDGNRDSRSSISFEGVLGALHALWARQNKEAIDRLKDFGSNNWWVMGAGPKEYTWMPLLPGLVAEAKNKLSLDISDPLIEKLKGYRGNVVANYLHLSGNIYGYINGLELDFLAKLVETNPANPLFQALYHRYTDGDQSKAIEILLNEEFFPANELPNDDHDVWDWSKGPAAILYIYTVAVIEGR